MEAISFREDWKENYFFFGVFEAEAFFFAEVAGAISSTSTTARSQ